MKNFLIIAGVSALALVAPAAADPGKDESGKRFEQMKKFDEQRSKEREKSFEHAKKDREKFVEQRRKEREKRFEQRQKSREKFVEQRLKEREKRFEHSMKAREKFAEQRLKQDEKFFEKRDKRLEKLAERRAKIGEQAFRFDDDRRDRNYIPSSYRSLYYDSPEYYYRYNDGGDIYRVDRQSNLVSGLIPLLGGGFGVGELLPAGFGAYNVPLQYRDTYYDTPDAYYRYGDNAIYQVDPQTQMIESVVALLTGSSLGVGQALPTGYDAYNLPLQYRDQYYDTDDSMYRYADGNIYQVDPQTQIIQAVISALV